MAERPKASVSTASSMMHGVLNQTSRIPPKSGSCEDPPPACPPPSRHRRVCQVIVFVSFFFYGFLVSILVQLGANLGQLGANLGQHDAKKDQLGANSLPKPSQNGAPDPSPEQPFSLKLKTRKRKTVQWFCLFFHVLGRPWDSHFGKKI